MRKKSRSKQGLPKAATALSSRKKAVAVGKNPIEVYPMREAVHRLEDALQATYKRLGLK